ncbi:MAG: nucleotidyl transferase AbiEii/AbiGii toxin family protein [Chitinivibrionia bacterium]|nr:nucleotidyl transferase AbiEii/AbiGii toxin family protein [Chitinivibrionia bacterium]
MNIVSRCNAHFYLTGGTALSRAYYNHRYSDDLDFFVNSDDSFLAQVEEIIAKLKENEIIINKNLQIQKREYIYSFYVSWDKSDVLLKLDFVNDINAHFGEIQNTNLFHRIDSKRNILSNKISALFRYAGKDVADLRELSLHENFNWNEIFKEACEKESGIDITLICDILKKIPQSEFDNIRWINKPNWEHFREDIDTICYDMARGGDNSLSKNKKNGLAKLS